MVAQILWRRNNKKKEKSRSCEDDGVYIRRKEARRSVS